MPIGPTEATLLVAYLLLGPSAWGVYLLFTRLGRRRMRLLRRPPRDPGLPRPSVTILIPAKDEGARIRNCLLSAVRQVYPRVEVLAIDDRSVDDTGRVMDELAAEHPGRLKVLHVTDPPADGWTGKNNALHQGSKLATGEWLLFVDSDVVLEPDALECAMAVALRKNFGMVSLLPRLESGSWWESLMVPLCAGAAASLYLIALNNVKQVKGAAFANGQFMLMSRAGYDQIGGHVTVRDRYCEDVAIAKLFKDNGLRPRIGWGNDFCSVRMYNGLPAVVRGWSRIYYAAQVGSPWRILIGMAWLVFCSFTVIPAFAWGVYRLAAAPAQMPFLGNVGLAWSVSAVNHFLTMTAALAAVYRWSGNPARNALMFLPAGGPVLMRIFGRALRMCVTKKVEWRGTAYQHTMAAKIEAPTAGA
ncbi:MAG: glycosyl transferase [Phycisphaerales bacterium]|nr:glycosyl transferase [Phycisphaerales bacterium]